MADPTDYLLEEWKECRATIGRFDTILADLRKIGFSLVTGLMSASAILAGTVDKLRDGAWPAVFGAVMLLTLGVFVVDRYYQVLQWATVRRAKELEKLDGPFLTTKISNTASKTGTDIYVGFIYAAFIVGTYVLATVVIVNPNSQLLVLAVGLVCLVVGGVHYYLTREGAR